MKSNTKEFNRYAYLLLFGQQDYSLRECVEMSRKFMPKTFQHITLLFLYRLNKRALTC